MSTTTPRQSPPSVPLQGEDLETLRWEDCRHWISIYADLLRFKAALLKRVRLELPKLHPEAQRAAIVDVAIIEDQQRGYQERLDLWYQRVWDLQGLWIDPEGDIVRYGGNEVALTKRERQLLEFLLRHPHRFHTAAQILGQAWADPALYPEEVRNYIQRLRKILRRLEVPCHVVNRPGRGYSLVLNP
ncbi:MAG TPA: winged helix-turn-helix domain-containing protein [Candidatus Dormibacteraeota bacterium]